VFEPVGVRAVHMDVKEGGAPIGMLSQRTVILHDRRFSPANAQLQLDGSTDTPVFFSLAVDKALRAGVVTLHVLPVGDGPSDAIRGWMRDVTTFGGLLAGLRAHLPAAARHVEAMVAPLLAAERAGRPLPAPSTAPARSCMT